MASPSQQQQQQREKEEENAPANSSTSEGVRKDEEFVERKVSRHSSIAAAKEREQRAKLQLWRERREMQKRRVASKKRTSSLRQGKDNSSSATARPAWPSPAIVTSVSPQSNFGRRGRQQGTLSVKKLSVSKKYHLMYCL